MKILTKCYNITHLTINDIIDSWTFYLKVSQKINLNKNFNLLLIVLLKSILTIYKYCTDLKNKLNS